MLIGTEVPWRFWRKRKSVPSSQPSATPSRESEEPNRWLGEDAGPDPSQYGVRLDTPVLAEARSIRTLAQDRTSDDPSSAESLEGRVKGSTRGTEFIDQ
jgi:hypothetical protein